jgi:hypothetical protein
MEYRARLVHADAKGRVVQVRAFEGERCLGSALGEAVTAEEAEDRAHDRLRLRFRRADVVDSGDAARSPVSSPRHREETADPPSPAPEPQEPTLPPADRSQHPQEQQRSSPPLPSPQPAPDPDASTADPEDWSADLVRLDALLAALGWGREQERIYLQRLFGQPSRSRLTRYADLMMLRRALEALPPGSAPDTAPLPMLRRDLLSQCDDLLGRLAWTTERARQWLEAHFAVSSRQRLSDDQLLAFNLLLESELLGQTEIGGAGCCLELPPASKETSLS